MIYFPHYSLKYILALLSGNSFLILCWLILLLGVFLISPPKKTQRGLLAGSVS